jgi:hypothetical protein
MEFISAAISKIGSTALRERRIGTRLRPCLGSLIIYRPFVKKTLSVVTMVGACQMN